MRRTSGQVGLVVALLFVGVAGAAGGSGSPGQLAPVNLTLPSVGGSALEGQTLSADPGSWGGGPPATFSFQWQRCDSSGGGCGAIGGANGTSYPLGAGQVGATFRVTVTAANKNGSTVATSAASGVVAALQPPATTPTTTTTTPPTTTTTTTTGTFTNTVAPSLSGSASVGATLRINPGSWTPAPSGYRYAWVRCQAGTSTCANSPTGDPTSSSYQLQAGDAGYQLVVNVAPNGDWAQSKLSNRSAAIAATTAPATTTTAPGPTTTSSGGTLLRNQSAGLMSTLWSTSTTAYGQTPAGFWDCTCFKNNDIQLATDASVGPVYSINNEVGSSNPWLTFPSNKASAEVSKRRDIRYGQWDWYGMAFKIPTNYAPTDWGLMAQFEYPSITSPPIGIAIDRGGVGLERDAGPVALNSSGYMQAAVIEEPRFLSLTSIGGKWVNIVLGVKWATDNSGQVEAWVKCAACGDTSYTLRWSHYNTPTMQYTAGQTPPTGGLDKQGLYTGNYSSTNPVPTNHITETGFIVATDRTTAQNALP
jgi:hypothetical protein